MFHKARIILTLWYLVIIMIISVFFSTFIYVGSTAEFGRIIRMQQFRVAHPNVRSHPGPINIWEDGNVPKSIDPDVTLLEEAKLRVLESLIGINIIILSVSFLAGYFLAGRTLKPIKKMMDDQNRFVSDSSHELRTPITSLRSEIEVSLRNKNLSIVDAKKVLESNLEEVISLQILSDKLLELAQNGKLVNKNDIKEVSILKIINDAVKKTEKMAKIKHIKIQNKVKDTKVKGVDNRLTEVFVILLDNAIKYSSSKNVVEITSRKLDFKMEIYVKDYGIGISQEDLPRVFDRFYRSEKSRTHNGYGLGLSIAQDIIGSHGGSISVESQINKQTVFTVILPA